MKERQKGLRHMMKLSDLISFEYWFGQLLADFTVALLPAIISSIILIGFDQIIMERENIWELFLAFLLFEIAVNCLTYLLALVSSMTVLCLAFI